MNTQRDKLRRQERLAAIAQEKALDKAERERLRERLPALSALSEITAIRRSPDKLPDPWLFRNTLQHITGYWSSIYLHFLHTYRTGQKFIFVCEFSR